MQSLRVTLYEIFGYLAPGVIAIFALGIGLWAVYLPSLPFSAEILRVRPVFFALIGFFAYMAGHLLQAIGNLHTRAEKRTDLCKNCENLRVVAVRALYKKYQLADGCESLADVVTFAFAILSQSGKTDAYEVFVYREGFYRAGYLSFAILALALLVRMIQPTFFYFQASVISLPKSCVAACFVLCSITSIFYFQRFRRFGEYRVRYVLGVISVGLIVDQNDVPTTNTKD